VAVLLNPPSLTSGTRSRNAVAHAATVLGCENVQLVNLCSASTPIVELNDLRGDEWEEARESLEVALLHADVLLAGWGVAGMSGYSKRSLTSQVDWLLRRAQNRGFDSVWMVGGEPRHPSRWHQYVADRHQRTSGGAFEDRIRQVLRNLSTLLGHVLGWFIGLGWFPALVG